MRNSIQIDDLEPLLQFVRRLQRDLTQGLPSQVPSLTSLQALMLIGRVGNPQASTNTYLAQHLGLTEPTVSSLVGTLLKMRLVTRIGSYNGRAKALRLTPEGKEALELGRSACGLVGSLVFKSVSSADRMQMLRTVESLNHVYDLRELEAREDKYYGSLSSDDTKKEVARQQRERRGIRRRASDAPNAARD